MGLFSTNGSGWGALGGVLGSAANMSYNAAQAEAARDFTREIYQNRYQWQVDDLRKAGLNPILAATNGMTNASNSALAQTSDNPGESAANSASAKSVAELNKQYIELAKLQGQTEAAKQREIDARANKTALEADHLSYELLHGFSPANARELELRERSVTAQISLTNEQINDLKSQQTYRKLTSQEKARLNKLEGDKTELISQAIALGLPEKEREAQIYRSGAGPWVKGAKEITGPVRDAAYLWSKF